MAAPVNPFPNYVPAALTDGDQVDASFVTLYNALDRSKVGLDAASIKDDIVVPGLTAVDPWQSLALPAPFIPATIEFYKDLMGIVRLKSKPYASTGASVTNGQTLATLPAGYRPGVLSHIRLVFVIPGTPSSGYFWCAIDTAGALVYNGPTGAILATQTLAFTGNWRAEN